MDVRVACVHQLAFVAHRHLRRLARADRLQWLDDRTEAARLEVESGTTRSLWRLVLQSSGRRSKPCGTAVLEDPDGRILGDQFESASAWERFFLAQVGGNGLLLGKDEQDVW